jgi:fructose-bisphosphate aldolase, class I
MTSRDLERVAQTLVTEGKGILAADETIPTLTRRFDTLGIQSTEQSRRTYREMLFTSAGAGEFISGVIMYDETIRQKSSGGAPFAQALTLEHIVPGIKVDTGAKPLAGSPGETVTEGLDGLRDRLSEYRSMGARFAKWRAVIRVTETLPSSGCVNANAHALGRYAALCQEQELVPIVEPEVLMDGSHTIERCEQVTGNILHAVFNALFEQGVTLEAMLLKPNMVLAGKNCSRQSFRPGGRDGDIALLAVACACCRAWHRFPVGRSKRAPSNGPSERNQPASRPETLENQLLLRTGASGSSSRGLAWERG